MLMPFLRYWQAVVTRLSSPRRYQVLLSWQCRVAQPVYRSLRGADR